MGAQSVGLPRGRGGALSWALDYAAAGWSVFPCKAGSKQPATPHGFKDATLDPDQIRAAFKAGGHNVGLGSPSLTPHSGSAKDCIAQ
jgi:hypothetical protein